MTLLPKALFFGYVTTSWRKFFSTLLKKYTLTILVHRQERRVNNHLGRPAPGHGLMNEVSETHTEHWKDIDHGPTLVPQQPAPPTSIVQVWPVLPKYLRTR
ncbi:hypothetical protein M758_5G121900 [Ceratodon purpureus]|nr:hypothetical protein M758_5G121900 [Ceratodon purpureus]